MTENRKIGYMYVSQTKSMRIIASPAPMYRLSVLVAATAGVMAMVLPLHSADGELIRVHAAGFQLGKSISVTDGTNQIELTLVPPVPATMPFTQSAVKQSNEPARFGPDPKEPYFTVRFALPIPPENLTNNFAVQTGMDPMVFTHNHSPGFEILPNGDALAVYFSTPPGKAEADVSTSFIQARLRYGAEEWDPPELFYKTESYNDQSGLLWNDGGTIRFFGGGRGLSDVVPFKMATSTDNGATWALSLPQIVQPPENFTAQPITSAFHGADGGLYFAMDGEKATSLLWRSADNGIHWQDTGGRTGGRHSAIVPLDEQGNLLSIGGKNASVNGWSPENKSTNFGASWSVSTVSPFPPLGSAQRPSLIKLTDGNLFFVSDAYLHKAERPPPQGWKFGNGCFVAVSTNNGFTWRIKSLPVQLPNHERGTNGTLGYVTARQAPNGVIHILTTETEPCLHYELNEAWVFSDAGDITPENSGGTVKKFLERYSNGKIRSEWGARICPNGRYLLDGKEIDRYENGAKQYEVTFKYGRKVGAETFWSMDGTKIWSWSHFPDSHSSVWTHYWPNGQKKVQSSWDSMPKARDIERRFNGLVADGAARQWNQDGKLIQDDLFSGGEFVGSELIK